MEAEMQRNGCGGRPVVKADGVWYSFGDGYIVKDVSLAVAEGEAYVVMGPNGAGKSTLLKLLAGILKPKRGDVYVCGYNSKGVRESLLARFIGYVPQNPWLAIFKPSVKEEILFTATNLGIEANEAEKSLLEIASRLNIAHLLNRSPFTLSEGEARRVVLASALVHKPRVVLLDEPTAGLDHRLKKAFIGVVRDLVKTYGISVVMATHDVEIIPMLAGFGVVLMNNGLVVFEGSVEEALENPEVFEASGLLPPTVAIISRRLNTRYGSLVNGMSKIVEGLPWEHICR